MQSKIHEIADFHDTSLPPDSIVAVSGLDGHAYGSWRGRGNLRRMWLRDFLCHDLPNCRTMIYGYNSRLDSHAIHTTLDFAKDFLEELTKARETEQVILPHNLTNFIRVHDEFPSRDLLYQ